MKKILLSFAIVASLLPQIKAQDSTNKSKQNSTDMNRIERTEKTYKELFGHSSWQAH